MGSEVNTELRGEDAQSRFQVLERPVASPGRCLVCGTVDRPVVDFGLDGDFVELEGIGFGRIYFCVTCVTQAALKFPENQPSPIANPTLTERDLKELEESLRDAANNVVVSWAERCSIISGPVDPVNDPEESREKSTSNSRGKSRSAKVDGQADESSGDERPASVSSGGFHGFNLD